MNDSKMTYSKYIMNLLFPFDSPAVRIVFNSGIPIPTSLVHPVETLDISTNANGMFGVVIRPESYNSTIAYVSVYSDNAMTPDNWGPVT